MAVYFTQEMIDTFTPSEREIFNNLAKIGKAEVITEKMDIKAYLAERDKREKEDAEARRILEASFV